ncbi:type II toxin-antitoxin system RelE family toxin [Pseudidiomarina insulisalsae]|uniref:Type II toxin-antitoxin system mRNA interferase toxin, RelE/StbE family n=1 Tax=Pseudidiomarina insulisalsae TaxID=575789 RepID=A0A432YDD7_9GAMM|nr:type II toxin-antitoxin system RelE/ParE family toxin [Pseudidiomarina insulisalsae]RUO59008.1 type II toxin-antitoxin system mRNA interferase toxin, RelE/StbE family [Pseudidiomarina insulisalsae]
MTYKLKFVPSAWKEWQRLAPPVKAQFKKKLEQRLHHPKVPKAKLSGYSSVYKIKLRAAGYRLIYEVVGDVLVVYVLAVGKRDKDKVYKSLKDQ